MLTLIKRSLVTLAASGALAVGALAFAAPANAATTDGDPVNGALNVSVNALNGAVTVVGALNPANPGGVG